MKNYKIYKHSPPHYFDSNQVYMITAATYQKIPYFKSNPNKSYLLDLLYNKFTQADWKIDAWVILDNHYHLLAQAPHNASSLSAIIKEIHKFTAIQFNKEDNVAGRKVWWNYWDACITFESSYFARLNYIHYNPVKHGYVATPQDWNFSSYLKFCKIDPGGANRIEKEYPFNKVKVKDDF
ncbi:transposase [candidate division WOR-3 bacterium]|nr:transposase [candidate division WOR-3 bacterium]